MFVAFFFSAVHVSVIGGAVVVILARHSHVAHHSLTPTHYGLSV